MASRNAPSHSERRRSLTLPPEMMIVLLGKNMKANIKVANFILSKKTFPNKNTFIYKALKVEQHCERADGKLCGKHIALIKPPPLFNTTLSEQKLNERVEECMSLCAPGPHVILLIIQPEDFTESDRKHLNYILKSLSEEAHKYTIVLTKTGSTVGSFDKSVFQTVITEWGNRHFNFSTGGSPSALMEMMEKMIQDNGGGYLKWEKYTTALEQQHQQTAAQKKSGDPSWKKTSDVTTSKQVHGGKYGAEREGGSRNPGQDHGLMLTRKRENTEAQTKPQHSKNPEVEPNITHSVSQKLNLVLCGSDDSLKASISDLLLGTSQRYPEPRSECVRRDGVVCGRSITLVEMPVLYNTPHSEEEVMREALRCVSLCDPGVHVFLLVIPVGPLTDADKGEMKKIQNIFSSKVNDHLIVLFTTKHDDNSAEKKLEQNTSIKNLLANCKHSYILLETKTEKPTTQASKELLDEIEKRRETQLYSLHMFVKAQEERVRCELEKKHKKELAEKEEKIQELMRRSQLNREEEEQQDSDCLRVVLIGKTGNGKSATGNTILGREAFDSETSMGSVTRVCHKAVGEVQGKSVAVVDTPGLFDTTLSHEEVQEEIVKCISLSAPGPHAFIIVLSVGRITKEELDTLDMIKMIFGPKSAMFTIVLFTRGDDLGNQTIHQYIDKSNNKRINKLLRDCGNRYLVFNNREKEKHTQVSELLRQIDTMVNSNMPSPYFTNSMFEEAETSIKKRIEEILKEKEREIQAEKEKLENKYSKEMEEMKKKLEEEKQKADEEKLQTERKFREKMENLKKEFEEKDKLEKKKREMEDKKRSEEEKIQMKERQNRIKELEREKEQQRAEFKKQLRDREEEDKKREERYKEEKENLRNQQKHVMEELRQRQNEDLKRREVEEDRRRREEENERQNWERKIKEAEHEKKEIQEDLKQKQREWEEEKKREMERLEEEDRRRKQGHADELRTKEEEQNRLREELGRKMEEERRQREEEKQQWSEAERKESERKEREYEEKRRVMEAEMKAQREEWERRKRENDERREEERQRHQKRIEEIEKERQEEIKRREREDTSRKETEEKEREEIKKYYEQKMEQMKGRYEDEARQQAEQYNEFNERKEKHFQGMIKEQEKQYERLESLFKSSKDKNREEIKKLQEELKTTEAKNNEEIKKLQEELDSTKGKTSEEKKKLQEQLKTTEAKNNEKIKNLNDDINKLKNKPSCAIL